MMWCVALLLVTLVSNAFASDDRQGKIFFKPFWHDVERGLRDTADVIGRVSDNLELAMDQLTDTITTGFTEPQNAYENFDENIYPDLTADDDAFVDSDLDPAEYAYQPPFSTNMPMKWFNQRMWTDLFRPFSTAFSLQDGPSFDHVRTSWWKGPNVCIDKEETDGKKTEDVEPSSSSADEPKYNFFGFGHLTFSSCNDKESGYTCVQRTTERGITKTIKVTYRCCHGFVRAADGCTKVHLTTLSDTLNKIGATTFNTLLKAEGLEALQEDKNVTMFVPTDEAMQDFMDDLSEKAENTIEENPERTTTFNLAETLLGHTTKGYLYAVNFKNEEVKDSENGESVLRINTYDTIPPLATVNCARILKANYHSENSVTHTIDRVLEPVTKNVADLIISDERFSKFAQLLKEKNLLDDLRNAVTITAFVPTNDAFDTMHKETLQWLMEGSLCLEHILVGHFVPYTICSAAVTSYYKAETMNNMLLPMEIDDDGVLTVGKSKVIEKDIVGTNGVIHVIDDILMRREDKNTIELLKLQKKNRFLEVLEDTGLIKDITKPGMTIFAPDNAAIDTLLKEFENMDEEKLKKVLLYHMVPSTMTANSFENNKAVNTSANVTLRMNLVSKVPLISTILRLSNGMPLGVLAGCQRLQFADSIGCESVVHGLSRTLTLPVHSVMQYLKENEEYNIFTQMIKDVGLEEELEKVGPYTVLAPSDHVFKTIHENELERIQTKEFLKRDLVKRHILRDFTCCSAIKSNSWMLTDNKQTLDEKRIHVRELPNGKLMAGPMRIINCGEPTENGIVHTVNRLAMDLSPAGEQMHNEQLYMPRRRLFDFLN